MKNLCLYRDKMEKILSLLEGKLPLRGAHKERAQLLLEDLKQSLKTDLERIPKGGKRKLKSHAEQNFYMPAINEAAKRISVETNSTPSQVWIDEIDIAQKYIKYHLNQLLS